MKIINKSTFRMNLSIWLIALVTISTTFFFGLYYNLSKNSLNNVVKDNLSNISKNKVDYLNNWLDDSQKFIKSLSQSESILDGDPQIIENTLSNYNTLPDNFNQIVFANAEGDTVYNSSDSKSVNVSDRDYFLAAKEHKDYISDKLISRTTDEPVIVISSPILKNGDFKGVVIGAINISKITELITPNTFENINRTFIINKSNDIISIVNFSKTSTENIKNISSSKEYQKYICDSIDSGHFVKYYINYESEKVFGSFTPLKHKNWVLISEIEISKQMFLIKKGSILAGILTLLFTTILLVPFILYLTKKFTTPLQNISNMASELASGNFSKRINYDSNNEIGILAKSFNTMADKLQNTYLELRRKISDLNTQKEEVYLKNLKLQQVIEVNKTILKQLEHKNTELEEANRIKAEFLSTMTHELRTPMNSIIGYTEMILDGNDGEINEDQEKDLNIILKSSEKLLGMINDVLNLSKIEAGKMNYNFKRFNLVNEIAALIENIHIMAESKNLELIFDYDVNLPEIYSDADKINHIVTNIISNAVKFTDEGYVKITVGFEDKKFAKISVEDTGIGIPKEDLDSIFDEFNQIDGSSTRKYGGTGLGLAIARAFTNGLGGVISVDSTLGKGSTFTLKIPVSKFSEAIKEPKLTDEPVEEVDLSFDNINSEEEKRIVVVTKNSSNYHAIKDILSKYDFTVLTTDYPNVIETVKNIKPGCIFIDIDVPCNSCHDGWTTLLDLQYDKVIGSIPKVVIGTQLDNNLCFTLGAFDYLIKPIKKQDLLNSLNKCFTEQTRGYALLIDDNKDNINLISKAIRKNTPYSTLIVTSLKDITNVLESSNIPKLIILNASMTDIKSFEIIKRINKLNLKNKIPIIIISNRDLSKLEHELLKQNSKKILSKSDIRYSNIVGEIKKIMLDKKNMV